MIGFWSDIMQNVNSIRTVHIELTDKCQAQCPMCARNHNGGPTRSFITNSDISVNYFKQWFGSQFLAQLNNFYSCGNYGDPVFAKDCLEIFQYVRECNPFTRLALHTNGSLRTQEWWEQLARIFTDNSEVVFAVDGFKGKHELYRKGTNFDKIISNIQSFTKAGGTARVDSLVFAHNEHEVDKLEQYLLDIGVTRVNFISTNRFYGEEKFSVIDKEKNFQYHLKPATQTRFKNVPNKDLNQLLDSPTRQKILRNSEIVPKCKEEQGVYVDPAGNIFPCCWFGSNYRENLIEEKEPLHALRNMMVQQNKEVMADIGIPNCSSGILNQNTTIFDNLPEYWQGENKCLTCSKQCSKLMFNSTRKI